LTVLDNTPLAVAGPLLGIAEVDEAEVVAMEPVELAVTVQVYVLPLVSPLTTRGFVIFARLAVYSPLDVLIPVVPPSVDLHKAT
jgi:hypothetical protein